MATVSLTSPFQHVSHPVLISTAPQEIARLVTRSGVAKARMSLDVYIIKSFLGGAFIALGGLADLVRK